MINHRPHDSDSERTLLGAMINSRDVLSESVDKLESDDFYLESHRLLFAEIKDEAINGSGVLDAVLLSSHLRGKKLLEKVGGSSYISQLMDDAWGLVDASSYIDIIKSHRKARDILDATNRAQFSLNASKNPSEVHSELLSDLSKISTKSKVLGGSLVDLTRMAAEKVLSIHEGATVGLLTGITELDEQLQGLKRGVMYVIAARPRIGKSTLVDQIATHVGKEGPVLILITEMSPRQRAARHLSAMTMTPLTKLNIGLLSSLQRQRVSEIASSVKTAPSGVYIESASGLTAGEVRLTAKKFAARHGEPALIVLDYLQ